MLKRTGPQTVKQLSAALEMTTMGIRQHLALLESERLLEQTDEQKQARGRPVRAWKLTEKGHSHFPDSHADVTLELISGVREILGQSALDRLIARRTENISKLYSQRLKDCKNLEAKVKALVAARNEEGYMAEYEASDNGSYLLVENHCPICVAATECQGFCQSELEVFQTVLGEGVQVQRAEHLLAHARRCSYQIKPKKLIVASS